MLEFVYDGTELLQEIHSYGVMSEDSVAFAVQVSSICNGNMGYVVADMMNLTYGMAPSRPWTAAYYHQCSGPGTGAIVARIPQVTEIVDTHTNQLLENTFQVIYETALQLPIHPTHRRIHSVNLKLVQDMLLLRIIKEAGV